MVMPANPSPEKPEYLSLEDLNQAKQYIKLTALAKTSGISYATVKGWLYFEREPTPERAEDLRRGMLDLADTLANMAGGHVVDDLADDR